MPGIDIAVQRGLPTCFAPPLPSHRSRRAHRGISRRGRAEAGIRCGRCAAGPADLGHRQGRRRHRQTDCPRPAPWSSSTRRYSRRDDSRPTSAWPSSAVHARDGRGGIVHGVELHASRARGPSRGSIAAVGFGRGAPGRRGYDRTRRRPSPQKLFESELATLRSQYSSLQRLNDTDAIEAVEPRWWASDLRMRPASKCRGRHSRDIAKPSWPSSAAGAPRSPCTPPACVCATNGCIELANRQRQLAERYEQIASGYVR